MRLLTSPTMTLTEAAAFTKKAFIIAAIGITTLIISYFVYNASYNYLFPPKPPEPEKPTVKFGQLPYPNLPQTLTSSSNYNYVLNTESGDLPRNLPELFTVYTVPQLGPTLLAPERAKTVARSLSFSEGPQVISPTQYRYTDQQGGQMTIDLNTANFSLKKNVQVATPSAEQNIILPDEKKLVDDFKQYLFSKNLLPDALRNGPSKVMYDNQTLQESNYAQINLWPEDIEKTPIVSNIFNQGLVSANIVKSDQPNKYSEIEYHYWEPDRQNTSTYPLKPIDQAFKQLKEGNAIVVLESKDSQVSISDIFIAYYESREYSAYIQPVYVFKGGDFVAYIPAIADQYLTKQ